MKKKRLKARVKTRLMLILAFLLFCGMGVTLWAGKRAEKAVSIIDTDSNSKLSVSMTGTDSTNEKSASISTTDISKENEVPEKEEDFEKHESVSMINTDSNIHTSQNGANTDSTKKEAELDSNEILEDKESDRNADSPTKEMVIHAEPVDTADVTHFYFFAIFFIGSGSVLEILIKKQVASGEIMGSQTRRKDM
jgi:hypothetical protein